MLVMGEQRQQAHVAAQVCVYVCVYVCMSVHVYVCICVCVCVCVCIYVYCLWSAAERSSRFGLLLVEVVSA